MFLLSTGIHGACPHQLSLLVLLRSPTLELVMKFCRGGVQQRARSARIETKRLVD